MSFEKMTFNQVSLNMKPFVEMPSFDVKRLDVASFDEIFKTSPIYYIINLPFGMKSPAQRPHPLYLKNFN